jgi:serine phosphatase RsbU (regulator of sigma subunit)/predicted enzyme related to lactoylglutathione lyase
VPDLQRATFRAILTRMASHTSTPHAHAHRCSFEPGRQDPYLRLGTIPVFVRDQERSLRFYLDQLGFWLASEGPCPIWGDSRLVTPPDGTATLSLVTPKPGSEEQKLIGRPTQIVFLTENVFAKFEEWSKRGVRFHSPPQTQPSGAIYTNFEDLDGNSFTLLGYDAVIREVEAQRRAHAERFESERRVGQELELARQVQSRLFPQTRPALATLEYAGVCIQARHVGGDYYDFLDLGRERLGLVVGDVSGKGIAAALLMSNLQAHLRDHCANYSARPYTPFVIEQPQRFLLSINRLFHENAGDSSFATLFFAEYEDKLRRLRYANCGHLPALVLRHDNQLERLEPTCMVLGLFRAWDCVASEGRLFPGDTVVLYTDGVTESFNEAGEEFGEARLIEAVRKVRDLPAQRQLDLLVDEVRRFSGHEQRDDITLVVAKCRGE